MRYAYPVSYDQDISCLAAFVSAANYKTKFHCSTFNPGHTARNLREDFSSSTLLHWTSPRTIFLYTQPSPWSIVVPMAYESNENMRLLAQSRLEALPHRHLPAGITRTG